MTSRSQKNSYSNPAFCQQSEFYNSQRCKSPPRNHNIRQSPVGAQTSLHILDTSIRSIQNEPLPPKPGPKPENYVQDYEEQEFYEEMIVDDKGAVQDKKFVVIHNDSRTGNRYASVPQNNEEIHRNRYAPVENDDQNVKNRYEYIPMQNPETPRITSPNRIQYHEEVEASTGRVHRYAVIPAEEQPPAQTSGRYALVPVEQIADKNRYAVITQEELKPTRYEYIEESYPRKVVSPQPRRANPAATQKLHELLTTPKKKLPPRNVQQSPLHVTQSRQIHQTPRQSHQTPRQLPISPIIRTPKQIIIGPSPRAQQKLNYTLGTRQNVQDKRNTAIVAPICSSPVQSVYSETTFSNKTESWMNLSINKPPVQATLTVAAVMMILCGAVTSSLCFYMISFMGRLYFLDFGIIAGFTCFILGFMGFRSRNVYWLPNRNYISGYFILSVFSLLTCAGLLVLLFMHPKPGTPLADMTSGAVCGISSLSLILAGSGVIASYCCKVPPPDNRVQHCAPGFTV